ncbi:hypothetical protein HCN44_001565 [Aphidius gifuensis]|uniref:CRAL-TRIO domain-containing protein n=1 Tax=Aphidius gifuensis TaxID=684658 RepID=A0A835CTE2_APHGI|nr:alpha-tocopherol transfer protein-like [Aphidius gifuensis]KAF7992240.1 hypothetical protein HCN44_001565 [Aphidius gifuensis]
MNSRNPISCGSYEVTLKNVEKVPPLIIKSSVYKFEPQPVSPEIEEKAKNELRETVEIIDQALAEMRTYLKDEPDLNVPDDDYFFAKFLRPCKWHAKPAFDLMKRFYRFRINHPRYCENLLPVNEHVTFSSGVLMSFPLRSKDGCRVVLVRGGKIWKPKEVSLDQIFRGLMLLLDAAIVEPTTQVCGIRVILDMDGLSLSHVTYFTPSFAGAVLEWVQKCLPARLKGVHIINQPYIFNMVFAIFKPFIHEKLRKRVIFHGTDKAGLKSYIGAQALPQKYGGDLDLPLEQVGEPLWNYLNQFHEEFEESSKLGYTKKN